jgi:alpha-mannosidase
MAIGTGWIGTTKKIVALFAIGHAGVDGMHLGAPAVVTLKAKRSACSCPRLCVAQRVYQQVRSMIQLVEVMTVPAEHPSIRRVEIRTAGVL